MAIPDCGVGGGKGSAAWPCDVALLHASPLPLYRALQPGAKAAPSLLEREIPRLWGGQSRRVDIVHLTKNEKN